MSDWADITPGNGSGKVQVEAPKPNRRRKRDWQAVAGVALTIATVIVGIVVWAMAQLESKASVTQWTRTDDRVTAIEARLARYDADQKWIQAALYQMAQHQNVFVPPPPSVGAP